MARVLVVDDHEIFLQGLVLLLERDERLEVVGSATNGADAVRLATELRPDVVLLDVVMPGMDGYEAAEAMGRLVPETAIVLVSGVDEAEASRRATEVGAAAFVTKAEAVERLPEIIVAVAQT